MRGCGRFGCVGVAPGHTLPRLASVYISPRTTTTGRSFHVKYRLHGRYGKIEHAGAFPTKREADLRARVVRDWIAQAKDPRVELARMFDPGVTIAEAGERWLRSRRAVSAATVEAYESRIRRISRDLDVEVRRLTVHDIDGWIDKLAETLMASTVGEYLSTLRAILDHAGVDPNPARDRRIEAPRADRRIVRPPDAAATLNVLSRTIQRHRATLVLIEQTGLRVSEALAVRPDHFDHGNRRLLVEKSKTGRPRWVPVPRWLADNMPPIHPASRRAIYMTLRTACDAAKVERFGPHMLRHRRASLWHLQHVPVVEAADRLGHSPEVHLRTYAHVMPVQEIPAQRLLSLLI